MELPKTYNRNYAVTNISNKTRAGFTLIEIIISVGLLAILGGLGLVMSMDSYRGHAFRNERDIIVSALQKARSQSISNMCQGDCTGGQPHGVYLEDNQYVIFQGENYETRASQYDEVIIAQTGTTKIEGPLRSVVFSQLSGQVAPSGIITISDKTGQHSSDIYVNSEGLITWTN